MTRKSSFLTRSSLVCFALALIWIFPSALLFGQSAPLPPKSVDLIGAINEGQLVTLHGNVPLQAIARNDRGVVNGSLPMNRIVLVLKRSAAQETALQAAIAAMHDPKSPTFHRWLTPAQFGSQYGASNGDIAKITAWLESHGFKVDNVAQGRGTIEFSGSADAVSGAFHTTIHSYIVNGEKHYANSTDPKIPAALSPVVSGVLSLHDFVKHPAARLLGEGKFDANKVPGQVTGSARTKSQMTYKPYFTGGGNNFVGPGDLWTIYNAAPLYTSTTAKIDGTGQNIAIVGRSDINSNDLVGFRANFLPAPYATTFPFTQIVNGPDPGISADSLEQTLDVEYSSALAPGAQVNLVVSASTNATDGVDLSASYIVDNNIASVMSTSYGECEAAIGVAENAFYNALWEQATSQGITPMVSSGDNGSAGCDLVGPSGSDTVPYVADEGLQVNGLASTPYNIAVGGNEFTDDSSTYWNPKNASSPAPFTSALSYIPEAVWNQSCSPLVCGIPEAEIPAGSGGASGCFNPTIDSAGNITACSGGYAMPDWQTGVTGLPTDQKRHLPDVSLTASGHDGYILCFQNSCDSGSFYSVGGTSASSPSFAGIMALVNQQTGSRQGQANYTIYKLASSQYGTPDAPNTTNLNSCNATNGNTVASSCIFHDVTAGTNAVPCDGGTLNCNSTTPGTYGVLTGYDAGTGYDSATGLGSVNVTNLVHHWNDSTLVATATTLAVGATKSTFGSPLALTIAVTPKTGTGVPTGSVALITDSTLPEAIGAGTVALTNGGFSGTFSSLPGGTYNVSGRYSGDGSYSSSTSTGSKITILPAASSAALTITGYDPITNAAVTDSVLPYGSIAVGNAQLTGVAGQLAPRGTVNFLSGSTQLASFTSTGDGEASYVAKGLALGSYAWKVAYTGDSNYLASSSPLAAFSVAAAPTTLRLLSNTSYVVGSGTAKLTAIVYADSLLLNPTGKVTFSVNGTTVGTATVAAYTDPSTGGSAAIATFSITSAELTAGANTVKAAYSGDGNYTASSSGAVSIGYGTTNGVNTIALTATPAAATLHQPITLTATLTTGGVPTTAGTVEFFDGTTSLGTFQVAGYAAAKGITTGTATTKLILGPGTHSFTAVYRGIATAPGVVTSSVASATVTGSLTSTTALTAVPNATNTTNYDLTAIVTALGLKAPTASVDFSETSVVDDFGAAKLNSADAAHVLLAPTLLTAADPNGASAAVSVVADFNGDGIPDVATANASFGSGTMSVLIGNGDGTFKAPVTYASGIFAAIIQTGDFNNDGVVDVALTCQYNSSYASGQVSVFLGNGDGTFQPQIVVDMPGYSDAAAIADFNHDGVLDIVTLQYYPSQMSLVYGNGDGTFQAPVNIPVVTTQPFTDYAMASGDFNGDGAPDVVEVNSNDNSIGIFLNDGSGNLVIENYITTVLDPQWVTVGDVNGDGKQDVLAVSYGYEKVYVLLGNGDGTFKDAVSYPINGPSNTLALGDMNGDGKVDLAVSFFYPNPAIGILYGNGDGTFGNEKDFPTNQGHGYGVTIADLNGDGAPDVISTDINGQDNPAQDIAILLNATQAKASLSNIAVAGPVNAKENLLANYGGDSNYNASSSAGVIVNGSGATATPAILWSPANPWGAGVALGTSVLNATTKGQIAGSFTYTAQSGTGAPVAVTTASTLALGTYTLTATFTPVDTTSYTTATATATINIVAPSFAVVASSTSLTITAGSSGTDTVSIASLYGFSGPVTLSSGANLPGGFTVTASPATISAGGSSTITIQTTGLSGSTAGSGVKAENSHSANWKGTVAGGIALSCLFLLPAARRRKLAGFTALCLVAVMSIAVGCGGAGFSNASIALTTSANSSASGSAVTLTATVTSSHHNPGGTVTFYNGATVLGTPVPVTAGVAALQISSLPVGLNTITAVYSGDQHNSPANSLNVQELITGQTSVEIDATNGTTTQSAIVQVTLQ